MIFSLLSRCSNSKDTGLLEPETRCLEAVMKSLAEKSVASSWLGCMLTGMMACSSLTPSEL